MCIQQTCSFTVAALFLQGHHPSGKLATATCIARCHIVQRLPVLQVKPCLYASMLTPHIWVAISSTKLQRPQLPQPGSLLSAGLSAGAFNQNIRRAYAAAIDQAAKTSLGSSSVTSVAAPSGGASGRRLLGCA